MMTIEKARSLFFLKDTDKINIPNVEMVNEKTRWLEILLEDEEKGGDR